MQQVMAVMSGSQIQCFAGRMHQIHHTVVLMAKIYYSKMIQSKISKGQRHMGQSLGETSHKLSRVSSQCRYTQGAQLLQHQTMTTRVV